MAALEDITILRIEIEALRKSPSPTREDYADAIRTYFKDCDNFEDWMVEPLLKEVEEHVAMKECVSSLSHNLTTRIARIFQ